MKKILRNLLAAESDSDDDDDIPYDQIVTVNIVIATISGSIAVGLCYIWIKVFRKVKFKDKSILCMIFSLILQMLSNVLWYTKDARLKSKLDSYD